MVDGRCDEGDARTVGGSARRGSNGIAQAKRFEWSLAKLAQEQFERNGLSTVCVDLFMTNRAIVATGKYEPDFTKGNSIGQ